MNIMLIGGTGFIGSFVADCLSKLGHRLTLFHRTKSSKPRFAEIQGDCSSSEILKKAIESHHPDLIIHMYALNQGHIEALERALSGRKMKLVLISSMDVYKGFEVFNKLSAAQIEPVPFTEHSPLRDIRFLYQGNANMAIGDDYEKILVEQTALQSSVLDTTVVRLGMVYGENDPNRRFKDMIDQMKHGNKTIPLHKKIANMRMSKCYVENVAHGIALAAHKGKVGEIYNLSDQQVFSELEWARMIAEHMNWNGEIVPLETALSRTIQWELQEMS